MAMVIQIAMALQTEIVKQITKVIQIAMVKIMMKIGKKIGNTVLYGKKLPVKLFRNVLSRYIGTNALWAGVEMCYPSTLVERLTAS